MHHFLSHTCCSTTKVPCSPFRPRTMYAPCFSATQRARKSLTSFLKTTWWTGQLRQRCSTSFVKRPSKMSCEYLTHSQCSSVSHPLTVLDKFEIFGQYEHLKTAYSICFVFLYELTVCFTTQKHQNVSTSAHTLEVVCACIL